MTERIDALLAAARAKLRRVHTDELADEVAAGALVVDIRPEHNRRPDGELPGAVVIERNELEWRLDPTSDDARFVACWLEPHCVSTVVAAVDIGRPAASQAVRVTLKLCSPTWLTQPPTTWPMTLGSMPVRSTMAVCTVPSSSAGCTLDRPPPRRPMGVRTASTITTDESLGMERA